MNTFTTTSWIWRRGEFWDSTPYLLFEDLDSGHWAYAFKFDELTVSPEYLTEADAREAARTAINALIYYPPRGTYEH